MYEKKRTVWAMTWKYHCLFILRVVISFRLAIRWWWWWCCGVSFGVLSPTGVCLWEALWACIWKRIKALHKWTKSLFIQGSGIKLTQVRQDRWVSFQEVIGHPQLVKSLLSAEIPESFCFGTHPSSAGLPSTLDLFLLIIIKNQTSAVQSSYFQLDDH